MNRPRPIQPSQRKPPAALVANVDAGATIKLSVHEASNPAILRARSHGSRSNHDRPHLAQSEPDFGGADPGELGFAGGYPWAQASPMQASTKVVTLPMAVDVVRVLRVSVPMPTSTSACGLNFLFGTAYIG